MARMIPPQMGINYKSSGEKDLFYALAQDPQAKNWIVLHSLDIAEHQTKITGEIDFVLLIPDFGVLCIEVKGCSKLTYKDGIWSYGTDFSPDRRGPFRQASDGMHSLKKYVLERSNKFMRTMFWYAVVFPYIRFEIQSPEWHAWQVIDNSQFGKIQITKLFTQIMENSFELFKKKGIHFDLNFSTQKNCEDLLEIIRPNFEYFENPKKIQEKSAIEMRNYTEEQFYNLDAMASNERIIFSGPAGTGKTLLAIEAARRSFLNGNKVLFICYNRLLGRWLKDQFKNTQINVTVGTLHSHMLTVAGNDDTTDLDESDQAFWEVKLPEMAIEKISKDYLYDEIIIDEFQDLMTDPYLRFLDASLSNGLSAGKWKFFGDFEKQMIYDKPLSLEKMRNEKLKGAPIYSMRINCRNTPRIASMARYLGGLNPDYKRILRADDGVEPQLIYYSDAEDQKNKLEALLLKYQKDGYSNQEIIILSGKTEAECCAKALSKNEKWQDCLKSLSNQQNDIIMYSTIHSFKGLESPIIILTDLNNFNLDRTISLCYVGMTRALNRLSILVHEQEKPAIINRLMV